MKFRHVILSLALALVAGTAAGGELSERSDQELKRYLGEVRSEIRDLERASKKLEAAGRASSNAGRSSAVTHMLDLMVKILHKREDYVGEDHTIIRYGDEVQTGLTDAAEVGTPIGNKETRRRLRRGAADDLSPEVRRLIRMRSAVVTAGLLEQPAIEKQPEAWERFRQRVREYDELLHIEENLILAERDRRMGIEVPDTLKQVPDWP